MPQAPVCGPVRGNQPSQKIHAEGKIAATAFRRLTIVLRCATIPAKKGFRKRRPSPIIQGRSTPSFVAFVTPQPPPGPTTRESRLFASNRGRKGGHGLRREFRIGWSDCPRRRGFSMFERLKRLFSPAERERELQQRLEELRQHQPAPLLWLFGKTQSGK